MRKCKHGHNPKGNPSPTYVSWQHMKTRCVNPLHPWYKRYGGRGITMCDRWLTFSNFLKDMGERPKETSLDRIDNEGNYEPENCRWATQSQQIQNSETSKISWKIVQSIRELVRRRCPVTQKRLAEWFGIKQPAVSNIVNGKTWKGEIA